MKPIKAKRLYVILIYVIFVYIRLGWVAVYNSIYKIHYNILV